MHPVQLASFLDTCVELGSKEKTSRIFTFLLGRANRSIAKEMASELGAAAKATAPKTAAAKDTANAFFGLPLHPRKKNTRVYESPGSDAASSPDRSTSPISGQGTNSPSGSV